MNDDELPETLRAPESEDTPGYWEYHDEGPDSEPITLRDPC